LANILHEVPAAGQKDDTKHHPPGDDFPNSLFQHLLNNEQAEENGKAKRRKRHQRGDLDEQSDSKERTEQETQREPQPGVAGKSKRGHNEDDDVKKAAEGLSVDHPVDVHGRAQDGGKGQGAHPRHPSSRDPQLQSHPDERQS
jgi:hypothetical protein